MGKQIRRYQMVPRLPAMESWNLLLLPWPAIMPKVEQS